MAETGSITTTSVDPSSSSHHGTAGDIPTQKAVIKNVDMSEEMQRASVEIALTALEKYTVEKDIAAEVKKEFDKKFGPTWHVVVGKNFGSYVTHGLLFTLPVVCSLVRYANIDHAICRNEALYLLLHFEHCVPRLEVVDDVRFSQRT
jgi:dynein light chain LC8-type